MPPFIWHILSHFVIQRKVTPTHCLLVQCTPNYLTHRLLKYRFRGGLFYIIKFGHNCVAYPAIYNLCLPSIIWLRFPNSESDGGSSIKMRLQIMPSPNWNTNPFADGSRAHSPGLGVDYTVRFGWRLCCTVRCIGMDGAHWEFKARICSAKLQYP